MSIYAYEYEYELTRWTDAYLVRPFTLDRISFSALQKLQNKHLQLTLPDSQTKLQRESRKT